MAKKRRIEPLEHDIQVACVDWWAHFCKLVKIDERLLYAVPNAGAGGSRGQAGKMKAEGTRPGIPDMNLDVPRGSFHGLRIEMKRPGEKPKTHQFEVHRLLMAQGYCVVVAHSLEEFMSAIMLYLGWNRG